MKGHLKFLEIGTFAESQIYEYKAGVLYNVVFSSYVISNAAEKNEFTTVKTIKLWNKG